MKIVFRILIIVALIAPILPLIIQRRTPAFMPHIREEMNKLSIHALDELEVLVDTLIYVGIFSLVLLLISIVGLLFFWPPSRELFIVPVILQLLIVGFKSYDKQMALSMMCDGLFYADSIAIVIVSYTLPIKNFFGRPGT